MLVCIYTTESRWRRRKKTKIKNNRKVFLIAIPRFERIFNFQSYLIYYKVITTVVCFKFLTCLWLPSDWLQAIYFPQCNHLHLSSKSYHTNVEFSSCLAVSVWHIALLNRAHETVHSEKVHREQYPSKYFLNIHYLFLPYSKMSIHWIKYIGNSLKWATSG